MTSHAVRLSYAVVVAFFACLAVAFASLAYSSHVQRQADRRWCTLFSALDPASVPPTNERGRAIADEIQRLRESFGCSSNQKGR